jgi:hypothetical protein
MNATIVLLITLNMVMVQENGVKTQVPAQLMYSVDSPILYLLFMDTVEAYNIEQSNMYKHTTIIRVSNKECRGFLRIYVSQNEYRGEKKTTGAVYFFKYCGNDPVDRLFEVNPDACYALIKKLEKQRKKNCKKDSP